MKKVLLTLLTVIIVIGALAGAGFAGYRIGYAQGVVSTDGAEFTPPFRQMNPNLMPRHRFDRDFGFGFNSRPPMMRNGGFGFSLFQPLRLLWNMAVLALVAWFIYWAFTRSGWRITRQSVREQEAPPANTEG